jgi:hypothetical protein
MHYTQAHTLVNYTQNEKEKKIYTIFYSIFLEVMVMNRKISAPFFSSVLFTFSSYIENSLQVHFVRRNENEKKIDQDVYIANVCGLLCKKKSSILSFHGNNPIYEHNLFQITKYEIVCVLFYSIFNIFFAFLVFNYIDEMNTAHKKVHSASALCILV